MSEDVTLLYSMGQSKQSQPSFHRRGISPSLNGEAAHASREGKDQSLSSVET